MMGKVVATYDGRKMGIRRRVLVKNQNVFRPELQKGGAKK